MSSLTFFEDFDAEPAGRRVRTTIKIMRIKDSNKLEVNSTIEISIR